MKYIVYQIALMEQKIEGLIQTNNWGSIVRQVEADSEEEAIGKFIVGTASVNAIQKLDVDITPLDNLTAL